MNSFWNAQKQAPLSIGSQRLKQFREETCGRSVIIASNINAPNSIAHRPEFKNICGTEIRVQDYFLMRTASLPRQLHAALSKNLIQNNLNPMLFRAYLPSQPNLFLPSEVKNKQSISTLSQLQSMKNRLFRAEPSYLKPQNSQKIMTNQLLNIKNINLNQNYLQKNRQTQNYQFTNKQKNNQQQLFFLKKQQKICFFPTSQLKNNVQNRFLVRQLNQNERQKMQLNKYLALKTTNQNQYYQQKSSLTNNPTTHQNQSKLNELKPFISNRCVFSEQPNFENQQNLISNNYQYSQSPSFIQSIPIENQIFFQQRSKCFSDINFMLKKQFNLNNQNTLVKQFQTQKGFMPQNVSIQNKQLQNIKINNKQQIQQDITKINSIQVPFLFFDLAQGLKPNLYKQNQICIVRLQQKKKIKKIVFNNKQEQEQKMIAQENRKIYYQIDIVWFESPINEMFKTAKGEIICAVEPTLQYIYDALMLKLSALIKRDAVLTLSPLAGTKNRLIYQIDGTIEQKKINLPSSYKYYPTQFKGFVLDYLIIENQYGKICWFQQINVKGVDFYREVNIGSCFVYISNTRLQKPCFFTFYQLPKSVKNNQCQKFVLKRLIQKWQNCVLQCYNQKEFTVKCNIAL